jgi:hypothetical protein
VCGLGVGVLGLGGWEVGTKRQYKAETQSVLIRPRIMYT